MWITSLLLVAIARTSYAESKQDVIAHHPPTLRIDLSVDDARRAMNRSPDELAEFTRYAGLGDLESQWALAWHHYAAAQAVRKGTMQFRDDATFHFNAAMRWWSLAYLQNDDMTAAHHVAVMVLYGLGTRADTTTALAIFHQLAKRDHAPSLHALGEYYYFSLGDREAAHEYWTRAAAAGHAESQFTCGVHLANAVGLPRNADWRKAKQYLRMAADQGHTGAQEALDKLQGIEWNRNLLALV